MAKLFDDKLELEISYAGFENGWVEYGFDCRWNGEPIFRDEPLKRNPVGWASRGPSQMRGNENESCCFLPFFDDLLRTKKAGFVEPTEPDFTFAVWPDQLFPFLPSRWQLVHEHEGHRSARLAREAARLKAGGMLDDDLVQVIIAFDCYQYPGTVYHGGGPALHLRPKWGELKAFADTLHAEFRDFAARHGVFARMNTEEFMNDEDLAWWHRLLMDDRWRLGS